ncbi:MAG: 1-acyl-sn-glycerol-3-phosphate acyltransferase [Acidimicrobiia bacterium]|nr:1-acyl-sn-glycerol-3-phosphate acyltransferase [Acidimicrobiia bacterium]
MPQARSTLRTVVDWITTIPTLVAFGLTLVVGDVVLRVSRLFGEKAIERSAGFMQRVLLWSFKFSGMRLKIERDPGIERRRGYIFVSNHQSLIDIPIFGGVLFSNHPKYIAKAELAKWIPMVSYNLRRGGNAVIDRANRAQAVQVIRDFGRHCQERGVSAVIFPEGTRSRDGGLKSFRSGGTAALLEAAPDLEIVPTTIDGSWHLLTHRMLPIPFGTEVRIRFGEPMARQVGERVSDVLEDVRTTISGTLDQWRAEPAI